MSAEDLDEMRNECSIEVMTYESHFEDNLRTIRDLETRLILPLLKLLPDALPPAFYKVTDARQGS